MEMQIKKHTKKKLALIEAASIALQWLKLTAENCDSVIGKTKQELRDSYLWFYLWALLKDMGLECSSLFNIPFTLDSQNVPCYCKPQKGVVHYSVSCVQHYTGNMRRQKARFCFSENTSSCEKKKKQIGKIGKYICRSDLAYMTLSFCTSHMYK